MTGKGNGRSASIPFNKSFCVLDRRANPSDRWIVPTDAFWSLAFVIYHEAKLELTKKPCQLNLKIQTINTKPAWFLHRIGASSLVHNLTQLRSTPTGGKWWDECWFATIGAEGAPPNISLIPTATKKKALYSFQTSKIYYMNDDPNKPIAKFIPGYIHKRPPRFICIPIVHY